MVQGSGVLPLDACFAADDPMFALIWAMHTRPHRNSSLRHRQQERNIICCKIPITVTITIIALVVNTKTTKVA